MQLGVLVIMEHYVDKRGRPKIWWDDVEVDVVSSEGALLATKEEGRWMGQPANPGRWNDMF